MSWISKIFFHISLNSRDQRDRFIFPYEANWAFIQRLSYFLHKHSCPKCVFILSRRITFHLSCNVIRKEIPIEWLYNVRRIVISNTKPVLLITLAVFKFMRSLLFRSEQWLLYDWPELNKWLRSFLSVYAQFLIGSSKVLSWIVPKLVNLWGIVPITVPSIDVSFHGIVKLFHSLPWHASPINKIQWLFTIQKVTICREFVLILCQPMNISSCLGILRFNLDHQF